MVMLSRTVVRRLHLFEGTTAISMDRSKTVANMRSGLFVGSSEFIDQSHHCVLNIS